MLNNAFTIASLFPTFLICIVYFSKQRMNTIENKIYSLLTIVNMIEIIIAIASYTTIQFSNIIPIINEIVSKLLLLTMFLWITIFSFYFYIISSS